MKNKYDVTIIGSGIGGLVSGCYLAKAGMKVLIVEKNNKTGGYCTSFINDEFHFDPFVHSFGSCRENETLGKILNDFRIEKELDLIETSPARVVIGKDKVLKIENDIKATLHNLDFYFPRERKGLEAFFKIVKESDYYSLAIKFQKITFKDFLKTYIINMELKNLFSFLLFQSSGLPASLMSAFFGIILMRDYILAGSYYPRAGMQRFPEILQTLFKKHGGTIFLNSEVKQVMMGHTPILKIHSEHKDVKNIRTRMVISNADPIHTLKDLIGISKKNNKLKSMMRMRPSLSCLALFLKLQRNPFDYSYVQFMPLDKDIEAYIYRPFCENNFKNIYLDCFFNKFDHKHLAVVNLLVPFNDKKFWHQNKNIISKKMVSEFVAKTGLRLGEIELKGTITPINLFEWTHSYRGASFGWEPSVSQVFPNFTFPFNIPNLYFVGHWLGKGHGISTVAYLGKYLAQSILDSYSSTKHADMLKCALNN